MTEPKPPADNSEIIEGVAVEKQNDGKTAGGRARRRQAKRAAPTDVPTDEPNGTAQEQAAPDAGPAAATATATGAAPSARMPMMLAICLAGAALVLALASLGFQYWRAGTVENALRAEIESLSAGLEAATADAAAARQETANVQTALADLAASLPRDLPPDLSGDLADLAARQDAIESGLAAIEAARPAPLVAAGDSGRFLAQSGMSIAAAMINDSRVGDDPSRWLATLSELRAAGLMVGDLDALRRAMSPLPPTHDGLIASARDLIDPLRQNASRVGDNGWWSAATGKLADFITLRRQGDPAAADGAARANAPLLAFERAVASGRLAKAVAASALLTTDLAALGDWQAAAKRRLALDDALASLASDMAGRVARAQAERAE